MSPSPLASPSPSGGEAPTDVQITAALFARGLGGLAVVDSGGGFVRVNPGLALLADRDEAELLSSNLEHLLCEEDRIGEAAERGRLLRGEATSFTRDVRILRPDGDSVWLRLRGFVLESETGGASHLVYQFQDLSEQQEALARVEKSHEVMLTAHKLEAVGRLAGGMAHEFNNLLTGIQGYTRLLLEEKPLGHPDRDALVKINRSVERATGLVAQLMAFGKQEFSQPAVLDLAECIAGSEDILRSLMGESVALDVDHMDPVRVLVDPRQLEQVLINLAMNARDAMPEGGMARLALDRVRETAEDGSRGTWAVVTFADTGCGIPQAHLDRIFEPFFSTRSDGKGLGLGLSAVHGIVEAHDGHVTVESEEGRGTTFRIFLPAAESSSMQGRSGPGEDAGPARILVVDDDPPVREVAARILRRLGYEVDEAGGASEALGKLLQGGEAPDLLLTDVVMPGMNGRELSEQVLKTFPGTRVLFMSAYTEDEVILRGVRVAEMNFLPKPFTLESLAEAVQDALQEGEPQPA